MVIARHKEQVLLRDIGGAADTTGGSIVVLKGGAGIGKSTLARWFADEFRAVGHPTYEVGAIGHDLELPLGLWCRLAVASGFDGVAVPHGLSEAPISLDEHARFSQVLGLIRSLDHHGDTPTLLVLDDLHAADTSSLLVLLQLIAALRTTSVLILATVRDALAHPDANAQRLLRHITASAHVVELEALTVDEVEQLIDLAVTGQPVLDARRHDVWVSRTAQALHELTGGVPLLVQEALNELGVADGHRPDTDDLADHVVTRSVTASAIRLLAALPDPTHRALSIIGQLGADVELSMLNLIIDEDAHQVLGSAIAAGVVNLLEHRVVFVHPTYREAARQMPLGASTHRRIADVLARRSRDDERHLQLRHLTLAGELSSPNEIFATAMDAGAVAAGVGDHQGAARAYDLAIDANCADDRAELLLMASLAHHRAGNRSRAWQLAIDAAQPAAAPTLPQIARAALMLARGQEFAEDFSKPLELLNVARAGLEADHPLQIDLLTALAHLTLFMPVPGERGIADGAAQRWRVDASTARDYADRAMELTDADGDALASAALVWRETHTDPSYQRQRRDASQRAMGAARSVGVRGHATLLAALDALEAADRSAADALIGQAQAIAHHHGDLALQWRHALVHGMLLRGGGLVHDATHHLTETMVRGDRADEPGRWMTDLVQGTLLDLDRASSGDHVEALLEQRADIAFPSMQCGIALALAQHGHTAEATSQAHELVAHIVGDTDQEGAWLVSASLLADTVMLLGANELAEALLGVLHPYESLVAVDLIDGLATTGCVGRNVAGLLGQVGRTDEAFAMYDVSERVNRAAGLDRYVVEGRIERFELQRRLDGLPRTDAIPLARQAERHGLKALGWRARRLAQPDGVLMLTDRQREILAGLHDGHTYREIADTLGFAHSTVRKDVLKIYAALDAHTRESALAAAVDAGLLTRER